MQRSWLLLALSCSFLAGVPAFAQQGKDAVNQIVALLASHTPGTSLDTIYENISKRIDFSDMSEEIVGSPQWVKLAPARKEEFQGLVQKLIEQRYYPRWHKLFSKGKFAYYGESSAKQDTYVKTGLTVGKKLSQITWRLHPKDGQLNVLSLSVGDKDLLSRLHVRFKKHLDQKGFDKTLAWLRGKIDEDDIDSDIAGHVQTH